MAKPVRCFVWSTCKRTCACRLPELLALIGGDCEFRSLAAARRAARAARKAGWGVTVIAGTCPWVQFPAMPKIEVV